MDSIEFRVQSEELDFGHGLTVTPFVNGTSLIELARRAELGPATEHGEAGLAGSYAGLAVQDQERWSHWYLDDDPQRWFDDGDSCLLGCTCGETGCWPLTARVTVTESQITWTGFRTGHRSWDLHGLGPFTFLRTQYETALMDPPEGSRCSGAE